MGKVFVWLICFVCVIVYVSLLVENLFLFLNILREIGINGYCERFICFRVNCVVIVKIIKVFYKSYNIF